MGKSFSCTDTDINKDMQTDLDTEITDPNYKPSSSRDPWNPTPRHQRETNQRDYNSTKIPTA